ncbi:AAA family ATPase [uncultured Microscilla sp.]|uniref:AAA family ATPase n=1 Tax=uncultured Microscilla sp. TaxID=432653 RepID=UPI00260C6272|nr:AAA family ATPase [uncultured Microscilla sp.]
MTHYKPEQLLSLEIPYDWDLLTAHFDWLQALYDCPQDPIYHAEGNVGIHTRMVVEALFGLQGWQQADAQTRTILFAACLLHDIAKPECTVIEPIEGTDQVRITSPRHAKKGEKRARQVLADLPWSHWVKEQVCQLVRFHGLPIWFLSKTHPEKAVIQASLSVNTEWLAWVAEADLRGRISDTQEEWLERIEFFAEFCREQHCFGAARHFASPHTRFLYFQKPEVYPDAPIYDNTCVEVFLLCGLPGAGKDTWIDTHATDLPVVSLDQLRQELGVSFKDNQGKVIQAAQEKAKEYLRKQQSFVWNATNITRQNRKKLIDLFSQYRGSTTIVYLPKPLSVVLKQNRERAVVIKEKVIYNFLGRLEPPTIAEAHRLWVVE